jgi:hypothetical protein
VSLAHPLLSLLLGAQISQAELPMTIADLVDERDTKGAEYAKLLLKRKPDSELERNLKDSRIAEIILLLKEVEKIHEEIEAF